MKRVGRLCFVSAAITALSGCVYYNAMWTAERSAKEARRLESRGQDGEARTQWARAAEKAESIATRHPRSRWADDALTLQVEGLAHAGACARAAAPIDKARSAVRDAALRERIAIAAAMCALASRQPGQSEMALSEALSSSNKTRRSQAELLAGQAAMQRFDYDAA